jgi:hypothetical protein
MISNELQTESKPTSAIIKLNAKLSNEGEDLKVEIGIQTIKQAEKVKIIEMPI